jgi:hypothetical protein
MAEKRRWREGCGEGYEERYIEHRERLTDREELGKIEDIYKEPDPDVIRGRVEHIYSATYGDPPDTIVDRELETPQGPLEDTGEWICP